MAAKNNLKRITLELDSKNSTVVLDDANLEKVFLCVEAIAENAGHMGFAASKVIHTGNAVLPIKPSPTHIKLLATSNAKLSQDHWALETLRIISRLYL
ncbi:hypothetical protein F5B17DRAFT_433935 [Nemania serpens]|nr:hypothetical protein F5B17DRAFT_433935 [Nemania serpens]